MLTKHRRSSYAQYPAWARLPISTVRMRRWKAVAEATPLTATISVRAGVKKAEPTFLVLQGLALEATCFNTGICI